MRRIFARLATPDDLDEACVMATAFTHDRESQFLHLTDNIRVCKCWRSRVWIIWSGFGTLGGGSIPLLTQRRTFTQVDVETNRGGDAGMALHRRRCLSTTTINISYNYNGSKVSAKVLLSQQLQKPRCWWFLTLSMQHRTNKIAMRIRM